MGETWRKYQAMISAVDTVVGEIVATLRRKNMWANTLLVWASDNGGPVYSIGEGGGANNYPLRGGKLSNYEGGFRVPAVVSGGVVPRARRNTSYSGITHFADWLATFAAFTGLDARDRVAEAA